MIKPTDIASMSEPTDMGHTRVLAKIEGQFEQHVHKDGPPIPEAERQCKAAVWHAIYGDIAREVESLRREVLLSVSIRGGSYRAADMFLKLHEMLHNPFE